MAKLADAIYCSNKGYIDREKDIKDILEHISVTTLEELNNFCRYERLELFDIALEMHDIPVSCRNSLSYLELLCIIDSIKFNYKTRVLVSNDDLCRLYYVELIADTLQRASKVSNWVRLFSAISLKAYLEYIDKQSGEERAGERLDFFRKHVKQLSCSSPAAEPTIGEVIQYENFELKKSWCPLNKITEYENNIYTAHEVLDTLLVSCIKSLCPKQFRLEKIKQNAITFEREQRLAIGKSLIEATVNK